MNVFELLRIHVSFEMLSHNMFLSLFGGCIKDDFVDIETCFWWVGQFGKFEHVMLKCAPFSMKLRLPHCNGIGKVAFMPYGHCF